MRRRKEFERRCRHDAERAFAANEKMLQVVAGIVLAQPPQAIPDTAVGKHDLDAKCQVAGVTEAQHCRSAGVGRQVAANGAAALGGQGQREQHAGVRGSLLDRGQWHAGFCRQCRVCRVERADAIHAGEREHNLCARRLWGCAAAHSCVSTLRHDGDAKLRARCHNGGDLIRRRRPDDCECGAMVAFAPVGKVGCDVLFRGQDIRLADDGLEPDLHGCANVRHGGILTNEAKRPVRTQRQEEP